MAMFNSYVPNYQRVKQHLIPLNHHIFPLFFLWFSEFMILPPSSTPQLRPNFSSGPRVLTWDARSKQRRYSRYAFINFRSVEAANAFRERRGALGRVTVDFGKMFDLLVGGDWNIFFIFPYIGDFIIPLDFHIFEMFSNHQPVEDSV